MINQLQQNIKTVNRLFQHYEGEIKEIQGVILKGLKYLVDTTANNKDVILFWLETDNNWLRIFIDGTYCGIDQYEIDASENDNDDDFTFIKKDHWVKNLTIESAKVTAEFLPLITLIITFTNGSQLILHYDKNENCTLKKNR